MAEAAIQLPTESELELATLRAEVTRLATEMNASIYRFLEAVRELDEREGWAEDGQKSCPHWLNWQCGIDLGAAREQVRTAHALKTLPQITEAFRDGGVSYSKVRAMTRVATAEDEDAWLEVARCNTASDVERKVRDYRKLEREEALEAENRRHDERSLRYFFDDDGCLVIKGRFAPEDGARIVQGLEAAMEEAFREQKAADTESVGRDVGPAAAQEEAPGEAVIGEPERAPYSARCADALARMAESYLAGGNGDATGGDRCTIHIHTSLDTLRVDGEGAEAELEQGGHVSAESARRLACDSGVVHWRESADGDALNVGRKTRSIPPAIRRALQRRDGGCRFPGCTAVRFVDAHLIQHWADGGETKLNNLVLLCRHHHRLIHEGGYGVEMTVQGFPAFSDPKGQALGPASETRFRGRVSERSAMYGESMLAGVSGPRCPRRGHGPSAIASAGVSGLIQRE